MSTIVTKNSSTASAVPLAGDLVKGELAVNVTDKKLYTKDNSATVVKVVGSLGNQEASAVAITGGTVAGVAQTNGTINNTPVGATTASTVRGTTITATTGFVGPLTGAVTGNVTGNVTGAVTGNVTGNLTGNVTAASGTSTFNHVTISGSLDMDAGTSATITGLATPVNNSDAATKIYVDTADALKLNLSGGTMSGALAMGTNKITGVGTPTATADAATKGYVDTSISNLLDSAPGALDTLNELAAALGDDPNFATTVSNEIATKVAKAGDTMSGNLAMGGNKVTGLGAPTLSGDAATKTYVDTADALKLNLTGGTMSGAIAMGTNKITGLGTPTAGTDATTKTYVDTADALKLNLAGGTMSGAIAMGSNKITGLGTPTADTDATTKVYVDGILGSATAAAASASAAATSETNAANSASAASGSASAASASASSAASTYDQFDDRYLGSKASAPTVDNDGNALLTGALYWNSTSSNLWVWSGSAWTQATLTAGSFATLVGTETLTNKTISADNNTLNGIAASSFVLSNASGVIDGAAAQKAIPAGVVVGTTDTQTLTNKTLTSPVINTPTGIVKGDVGLGNVDNTSDATKNSATATLTNKTIEAGTFTNGYTEEVATANTSTAYTIDLANGSVQILTLTGNCTFTFPTATAGRSFILILKQDGTGSRTVTWPAAVKWPAGTAPTITSTASKADKYVFTADGSNWIGSNAGQNYTV